MTHLGINSEHQTNLFNTQDTGHWQCGRGASDIYKELTSRNNDRRL
jgi:hypothetical protein